MKKDLTSLWITGAKSETETPQATRAMFTQGSIKQSPEGAQEPHIAQRAGLISDLCWDAEPLLSSSSPDTSCCRGDPLLREFSFTKMLGALKINDLCVRTSHTPHRWQQLAAGQPLHNLLIND